MSLVRAADGDETSPLLGTGHAEVSGDGYQATQSNQPPGDRPVDASDSGESGKDAKPSVSIATIVCVHVLSCVQAAPGARGLQHKSLTACQPSPAKTAPLMLTGIESFGYHSRADFSGYL